MYFSDCCPLSERLNLVVGDLKALNLIYINYDIIDSKEAVLSGKLKMFSSETYDSNQNFSGALAECVLDVLY